MLRASPQPTPTPVAPAVDECNDDPLLHLIDAFLAEDLSAGDDE